MLAIKIVLWIVLLVCTAFVVPTLATTYYVGPCGNDSNDGQSWATAFATIQKGIDTSSDDDVVEVNQGIFNENIDFGSKSITVHGTAPAASIINGNGLTNVVAFGANSDSNLSGFTVTGGTYGIYSTGGTPTVSNCIIKNNNNEGIYAESSTVTIKNSTIHNNNAGVGIEDNANTTISNCTIVKNSSYGITKTGEEGTVTISNCIVWDNSDDLYGCSATYSCIQDGDSGTGNISSYPYFADYNDGNDFHLTWNSPCINKGDPDGNYTGQTDIDGEERVIDSRVDIGADEKTDIAVNLVKNPGFELGGGGFNHHRQVDQSVPKDWNEMSESTSKSIDSSCSHSDGNSWKFTNDGTKNSGAYSDWIEIDNNESYEFSVWVKTEGDASALYAGLEEFNADGNSLGVLSSIYRLITNTMDWTKFFDRQLHFGEDTKYVKVRFFGPYKTAGTVWWDDFVLQKEIGTPYLPAYGCVNEPNIAETVKFGSIGLNENWVKGTITSYMSAPCTDSNDKNITYRELKANKDIEIEFPAVNVGPNDANGLPFTPMLLEIMFKDTVANEYDNVNITYDLIKVSSKIDWIYQDPCYLASDTNRYCPLISFGGFADGKWKYVQYGFQKSDLQLLRAVNGKYTIKIENNTNYSGASHDVPIDYVCLRQITDSEWQSLYERQRDLRFKKVEFADKSDDCNYADPNLVIFCRDFMHPVYKDTKPAVNEPCSIETFSAWSEVEPISFSIYSEGGVEDLNISVSNLTCDTDVNSFIDGNNISVWQVVYDEARLGYVVGRSTVTSMACATVPDRLKKLDGTLSVAAGTSKSVWLKINVPAQSENLSAGDYKGHIRIQKSGVYDETIDVTLTVYDINLDAPTYLNYIYHDPYRHGTESCVIYSDDISKTFEAYRETEFDAYYYSPAITVFEDTNEDCNIGFDANLFESRLDRMIAEGYAKHKVNLASTLPYHTMYEYSTGKTFSDSNALWSELSDPCFCKAMGRLINKYCEIGQSKGIEFIFHVGDEPSDKPYYRILCDRLYTIMKDPCCVNDINRVHTAVTYYSVCDNECPPGDYIVPTEDGNIPPLTDMVDYKIWSLGHEQTGYIKHQDSNYHGYMGYYTTSESHYRNPVYNRFLHGLFAYTTDACSIGCYAMGDYIGDPYNDLDSSWRYIWPFAFPDFLLAYPTWSGEINHTIGGLEAIREGIKDGRYFATLRKLIAENPNNAAAQAAQEYLDDLKNRIGPDYSVYENQPTELGHYQAILKGISLTADPNDYEVFTEIRKQLAEYIGLLIDSNDYSVWNVTQNKFYTTIQNGINSSSNGDELITARKTHLELVDFGGKNIILRSFDPNDLNVIKATIINGGEAANVVEIDSSGTLKGLTITGGQRGVYCSASSPTIGNCIIAGNSGEGIYADSATVTVKDSVIYDNNEGLVFQNADGTVRNNMIVNNTSFGIRVIYGNGPSISNCIIWENNDDLNNCSATYSCIEDGDAGTGNISLDPCFVDANNNDFHINNDSPCLNAGDPDGNYTGETDIDGEARAIGRCVDTGADEVYFNAPEPNGHWWKLDEISGVTAYDSVDTNNGTFNGNDPCWVTGHIGGAADFNGVSDYFSISDLNNVYTAGINFTIAGWFKTSQLTGIQTIVGNWSQWYQYNMGFYSGWQVLVEDNKVKARFATNCPVAGLSNITGTKDVNDGNWHHFALVYPKYSQGLNVVLYVDGQSEGTPGVKYFTLSNTKFRIGDGSYVSSGSPTLKGGPFCGTIDDVMIFNRTLTADEVEQLFLAGQ